MFTRITSTSLGRGLNPYERHSYSARHRCGYPAVVGLHNTVFHGARICGLPDLALLRSRPESLSTTAPPLAQLRAAAVLAKILVNVSRVATRHRPRERELTGLLNPVEPISEVRRIAKIQQILCHLGSGRNLSEESVVRIGYVSQ